MYWLGVSAGFAGWSRASQLDLRGYEGAKPQDAGKKKGIGYPPINKANKGYKGYMMVKVYISVLYPVPNSLLGITQLFFGNPTMYHDVWSILGDDYGYGWPVSGGGSFLYSFRCLVSMQTTSAGCETILSHLHERDCNIHTEWFPEVSSLENHYRMYLRLSKENIYQKIIRCCIIRISSVCLFA